jgi:hypothetical protein
LESWGCNETPGWKLEWDRVSDVVWEALKEGVILGKDEVESGEEEYFTPPESPSSLDRDLEDICCCTEQGFLQQVHYTPTEAERLFHLHHVIVGQLIDPVEAYNYRSKAARGKSWAKRPFRQSLVYYPDIEGLPGRTIKFETSMQEGTCDAHRFSGCLKKHWICCVCSPLD